MLGDRVVHYLSEWEEPSSAEQLRAMATLWVMWIGGTIGFYHLGARIEPFSVVCITITLIGATIAVLRDTE